ncbi:rhodanese-like domain-containing protein [Rhodovulum adriaticum]|uniref:Rhodanese-related sulfurtransferase n=1 Tax=Rhodovulum adriaticum TaxID=35804 RepID=A0A4R2NMN9_RHOAD|nr:rhodanese-like domain-containing protein [Rhodovulum adriaticum]MBK1636352.1 sulfurtransferase [Rhodovulum adriaticum]TCP22841.1 rhodanese-related sulfurtransferase [Rhodovulum adriaticum]
MKRTIAAVALALAAATPLWAEDGVGIRPDRMSVTVQTPGGSAEISRIQDTEHELSGEWARTSRPCPPFCIQPMIPAEGVDTIGEIELLEMLENPDVIVIDSRTQSWFESGSIPGAVNMPYTETVDRLAELGCALDFDGWACEDAREVALFCNGPWCGQSPTAIRRMIEAGYPAERIHYYRGGMQVWRLLGLSVTDATGD